MPSGDLTLYTSGYSLLEKTKLAQSEQRRRETLDSSGRPKVERFFIEDTYSVVAPRAAAPSIGVSTTTFTSSSFTTDFATSPTPTLFPTPSPSPSAGIPSGFIPDFSSGATEFADPSQAAGGGPDLVLDNGYGDEPNRLRRNRGDIHEVCFIGADELFARYLPETQVDYRQEWDESYFYRILTAEDEYISTGENPRVNTYTYHTGGLHPIFDLIEKERNQPQLQKSTSLNFPSYPVPYEIENMNFVVRTLNFVESLSGQVFQTPSTAPPFPLNITDIKETRTYRSLLSRGSGKIYYSTLLRIYKASNEVINFYNDPDFYYARQPAGNPAVIGLSAGVFFSIKSPFNTISFPLMQSVGGDEGFQNFMFTQFEYINTLAYLETNPENPNQYISRSLPRTYNIGFAAYDDIGVYMVYDLNTNTSTIRTVNISDLVNSDPSLSDYYDVYFPGNSVGPSYYFFDNLDAEDPEYQLSREYLSTLTGTEVFIKSQFEQYSFQWPRYSYYSREKRILYILLAAEGDENLILRDVWAYKFKAGEPANTYSEVLTFISSLGSPFLDKNENFAPFTAESLKERGFKYVDIVDITPLTVKYAQNLPVPVIKFNGKF